jgi:hypothetical protein
MFILDAAREIQPPFNPDDATTEFSTLLKAYGVGKVIGDRYTGEWVREPFRRHGVEYQLSEVAKSDIYRDALPLFNAGRAQLLDLKRLVNQESMQDSGCLTRRAAQYDCHGPSGRLGSAA